MLCTQIVFCFDIQNNLCFQHVLKKISTCSELSIFMYWTCNSINNLLSYCELVDARISASEKDLPVSQNIIHVHALGPPLFVTDFSLVFQVSNNFCFSRQSPDQTASIRGWDSNWGFNFDIFRVNSCSCFIHQFNQLLKKISKKG